MVLSSDGRAAAVEQLFDELTARAWAAQSLMGVEPPRREWLERRADDLIRRLETDEVDANELLRMLFPVTPPAAPWWSTPLAGSVAAAARRSSVRVLVA